MFLDKNTVEQQSMAAWNTWRKKWVRHCKNTRQIPKSSMSSLISRSKDKILVQAAFGASLTKHIPLLKEYRHKFQLMCCDKAFGFLMENGITPDYCMIADASVSSEWMGKHDTTNTILIANIAANPEWTVRWKGEVVFYANWDNIGSAGVLSPVAEIYEVIPASSNVSNAQVVFASQVLNPTVQLLVGYDYSWRADENYYASGDHQKRHLMHHMDVISPWGYLAQTSSNLSFSCLWLQQYLMKFPKVKIFNCSGEGILSVVPTGSLEIMLKRYEKERHLKAV